MAGAGELEPPSDADPGPMTDEEWEPFARATGIGPPSDSPCGVCALVGTEGPLCPWEHPDCPLYPSDGIEPPSSRLPDAVAIDADGYWWRCWAENPNWSMVPVNPSNDPIPQPVRFYRLVPWNPGVQTRQPTRSEMLTAEYTDEIARALPDDEASSEQ